MEIRQAELIGGPFAGTLNLQGVLNAVIPLPLNDDLRHEPNNPTVLALYARDGELPIRYRFMHVQRLDGNQFAVEFVGGPFAGTRPFGQPASYGPETLLMPLGPGNVPYNDTGNPIGYATYRQQKTDGVGCYNFDCIDTTPKAAANILADLNRIRLRQVMDGFYADPNYDIYSLKPTDLHKQIHISYGTRKADVDELLAPLILELWKMDYDTLGSCQELANGESAGMAYVSFPFAEQGTTVHQILTAAGIDSVANPKKLQISPRNGTPEQSVQLEMISVQFSPKDIERVCVALADNCRTHSRN